MSKALPYLESQMSKRTPLAEQLPLDKPFTVQISISRVCDFKCEFCHQSLEEAKKTYYKMGHNGFMEYQLLQHIVDDIQNSFGHVKQVQLTGIGEPLLHPAIGEIVSYIANSGISDRVTLITNGSNLTPEMSDKLTAAGLTHLRISVNGLSDADFMKYCNVRLDFNKYIEQIRYLYEHKRETTIYIKIINYMVDTPERRQKFYQIFEPICDVINIENLMETSSEIDFSHLTKSPELLHYTKASSEYMSTPICSIPFYTLIVDEDGSVFPCCDGLFNSFRVVKPPRFGNIKDTSLGTIWEKKAIPFQRRMLDGIQGIPYCESCTSMLSQIYPEDVLDGAADRLKAVYDAKMKGALS